MDILASCTYEESVNFNGKLVVLSEDGTQDKVSLNIVVDNGNTAILQNLKPSVRCITYVDNYDIGNVDMPDGLVFMEYSLGNIESEYRDIPNVTPILRVPDGYSNMRELHGFCEKYPRLRIIGGNLLAIEGVRIGRYEKGKNKGSPVFNGVYDIFLEAPLSGLENISEIVKKARKRISEMGSDSSKASKQKKSVVRVSNISKSFESLFSDLEEEEF